MDENTQDTSNDAASSMLDSDLEKDTIITQPTTATELSQVEEPEILSVSDPI